MTPKQHLIQLWRDSLPERFKDMKPYAYTDKTANGLTRMVMDWIKFNKGQSERINVTGRFIKAKMITDVVGFKRQVGNDKWIKGSGTKGSADISAIIKTEKGTVIPWKIEVKIGKDKQSDDQIKYQKDIEKVGGIYTIAKNFDEFYNEYFWIMKNK